MTDMQVEKNNVATEIIHIKSKPDTKKAIGKKIYKFIKRFFDIIAGIVGLIILLPLTVIVWIVNKINKESGPIFYAQTRIGKDGKEFKIHKFRTMCVDADEKLQKLLDENEDLRKEWEENRKLVNDPRITKFGRILRKTSLDEFPNFLDVLSGKMSLIGPRAVVKDEIKLFGDSKDIVLSVKPGITGYWAANGRSNVSYEKRVEMERYYAENMSLWLDTKIFFKTIVSIMQRTGAM